MVHCLVYITVKEPVRPYIFKNAVGGVIIELLLSELNYIGTSYN